MSEDKALELVNALDAASIIIDAARLWSERTTDQTLARRADLVRDKVNAVTSFFTYTRMRPAEVSPADVRRWQEALAGGQLTEKRLSPSTIYIRTSHLSSFFRWAMANTPLGQHLNANPVALARPKKPKPYRTKQTKSLLDDELRALVGFLRGKADDPGHVVAKRDYALLQWYVKTGRRRNEVISLRGSDVQVRELRMEGAGGEVLIVRYRIKGGRYLACELRDPVVRRALFDYLQAGGRQEVLGTERPLWTRHDRAGQPGAPLTSHAFVKNLKGYAKEAGLDHIHNHMTRHTFARIVSEETGSMLETQEALDHEDQATTRAYVDSISVKRDKYSERISRRVDD
jgi:integrase